VITGSRHDDPNLERFRGRRIEIEADTELPREVDGEVISPGRSLTVTLRPGALLVRVPARGLEAGELQIA
jgi:undecaprenyl-diphosphatase